MENKRFDKPFNRVVLEVDLDTLASNIRAYQEAVSPAEFLAVVKAYGYGTLGMSSSDIGIEMEPVIQTCLDLGVKRFAVSRLVEAEELRKLIPPEFKILILGNCFPEEMEGLIRNHVTVSVSDLADVSLLEKIASRIKIPVEAQILVDTGMGRLGIPYSEVKERLREFLSLPDSDYLHITGLYSHLSNAHIVDDGYTLEQIKKFSEIKEWVKKEFSEKTERWEFHLANSWGAGNYPESYHDVVRVGIGLYGVEPQSMKWVKVKPAVTLKSHLLTKRLLPTGHAISYDCRYRLTQDTWVGTVAVGYADGIPLSMSSAINHTANTIDGSDTPFRGHVLIRGRRVPILGKVTMDYTMVNLNGVEAEPGDEVVFFGRSGDEEITVRDFADIKGSHGYEVLCSLPLLRVPRVYLKV